MNYEMTKQTLWVKKRTSRGGGRAVNNRERHSFRNIDRDVRKNQLVYSHYLLKFVLIFAVGLLWIQLGASIGPLSTVPIGLLFGLAVIYMEKLREWRKIELCLLVCSCLLSYFLPIGIVL